MSPAQKEFLPAEDCVEHCFTVESLMEDSIRRRNNVWLLWLDFKNAFGSVSHDLLWRMLGFLGVPADFVSMFKEIYSGSSQIIRYSRYGYTKDIPLHIGIK